MIVGSSEHEEEERCHKEHQVARDDGDVDGERVDGTQMVVDNEEHFSTITLEIVLAPMSLCRMSMLIALMNTVKKRDIWCGVCICRAPNNSVLLSHSHFMARYSLVIQLTFRFTFVHSTAIITDFFHGEAISVMQAIPFHFMSIAHYRPSL